MNKISKWLSLTMIALPVWANEHQVTISSTSNYENHEDVGISLNYKYFTTPNVSFELGANQSGEIHKETNSGPFIGEFDSVYLAAGFRKPFAQDINALVSGGLVYVTDSTNELLIEKQSTMPYLSLGVEYNVNHYLALNLQHISHFGSDIYKDMHYLSAGISIKFGAEGSGLEKTNNASEPIVAEPQTKEAPPAEVLTSVNEVASDTDTTAEPPVTSPSPSLNEWGWGVQVASFGQRKNAEAFLTQFNSATDQQYSEWFTIVYDKSLYRVIALKFTDKSSAQQWQQNELRAKEIASYILQIANKD